MRQSGKYKIGKVMHVQRTGMLLFSSLKNTVKAHPYITAAVTGGALGAGFLSLSRNKQNKIGNVLNEVKNYMILSSPELNPSGYYTHVLPGNNDFNDLDGFAVKELVNLSNNWFA